ncbi:hypothetical protein DAEQUDRAFT_810551 [Daedalea quercina L-15889]|uniref:F-box domain-containing protein n=1 Tax=Daedalea quercina L-15889 TaxID=1314783 RepID=A0A165RFC1_9APHY|nr:hypothetical protein DAEQUDRAFT_810551 [Daedalea quercina L-15889]
MSVRLLLCRELLDQIFKYFGVRTDYDAKDPARSEWHKDLLNSALAGRALYEPALDVLWGHLDNIDKLLLLLGDWKHRNTRPKQKKAVLERSPVMFLRRGLCSKQFVRFQHHARRVVWVAAINHSPVHPPLWRILSQANGGRPLLPRLRFAGWYPGVAFDADLLLLIPLTLLSLNVRHWDNFYDSRHELSANSKYRLKCIMAARHTMSDCMVAQISNAAPNLTTLRIHMPRFGCLVMLSRFRKLSRLTLDIQREFDIPKGVAKIKFPALQSLEVVACVKSLNALVESIDCPQLSHVDVRTRAPCTIDQFKECLDGIACKFGSTLRTMAIRGWQQSLKELREGRQDDIFPAAILPVLGYLPTLQSLELSGCTAFWTSGFALDTLLATLPALRSLKLILFAELPVEFPEHYCTSPPTVDIIDLLTIPAPTLQTLLDIPELCPTLETLELPIIDMLQPPNVLSFDSALAPLTLDIKLTTVRKRKSLDYDEAYDLLDRVCPGCTPVRWLNVADEHLIG